MNDQQTTDQLRIQISRAEEVIERLRESEDESYQQIIAALQKAIDVGRARLELLEDS